MAINFESGSGNSPTPEEQIQQLNDQLDAVKEQLDALKEEKEALRKELDERDKQLDILTAFIKEKGLKVPESSDESEDDEEEEPRKKIIKKGIGGLGLIAGLRNLIMKFYGDEEDDLADSDEDDEDDILEPLNSEIESENGDSDEDDEIEEESAAKKSKSNRKTKRNRRSNRERKTSRDETDDSEEIEPEETESNSDDNDELAHEKKRGGNFLKRAVIGGVAAVAIAATGYGFYANSAHNANSQAIQEQTDAVRSLADQTITDSNLDEILNRYNETTGDLQSSIDKDYLWGTSPSDVEIDEGEQALVDAEQIKVSIDNLIAKRNARQEATANLGMSVDEYNQQEAAANTAGMTIDNYMAKKNAAANLGVSIDSYLHYEQAANDMQLPVERVIELATHFGVPADKLGTSEAQSHMRDQLAGRNNVSEKFANAKTPEEFGEVMIFTAYNNKGALAQYINALDEDGSISDAGIDGLEMPVDVDNLYQKYCSDESLYKADFTRFVQAMQNSRMISRDATTRKMYSYYLSDNNRMVCSLGPENSGGETDQIYQVEFLDEQGNVKTTILVKNGCFQIEAGNPIPVTPTVVKPAPSVPVETPSTPPKPTEPETPPTEEKLEPKDPTANDKQQNDAEGFEDKAEATEDDQTYDGEVNQDASASAGNTDGDASNGSEVVPDSDETGQIPGHQNTGKDEETGEDLPPAIQDW